MKSDLVFLENIVCPICHSDDYLVEFCREDFNMMIPGDFCVVRCKVCDHMYLNPRPTTYSIENQLYTEEYDQYKKVNNKSAKQSFLQRYGFRKRYRIISKYVSSGKILDVGCASGEFLNYMENFPEWSRIGLEPITQAANLARENPGVEIFNNTLQDGVFDKAEFDVVTFWHVFEHVEDPVKTLNVVNSILVNKGITVITLPILRSIDHRIFGKYWIGFELPRHLHFFSKEKMMELLNDTGFKLLESRCLYGSHAMTMTSLKFWLRSKNIISEKFIAVLIKVMMSAPVRVLMAPIFLLLDNLQLSTPITFVAKKCEK